MKYYLLVLSFVFLLTGCIVRTYPVTKDRIDQDLAIGNRGYLKGTAPSAEAKEKKTTRTTQVVEIELYPLVRFEGKPKVKPPETTATEPLEKTQDQELWGNQGYLMQSQAPEIAEPASSGLEKYAVQKGDTLQKISQKLYGTSRKWNKIYQANKDILRAPDKIYPGQVINIPAGQKAESLKEPKENLK